VGLKYCKYWLKEVKYMEMLENTINLNINFSVSNGLLNFFKYFIKFSPNHCFTLTTVSPQIKSNPRGLLSLFGFIYPSSTSLKGHTLTVVIKSNQMNSFNKLTLTLIVLAITITPNPT